MLTRVFSATLTGLKPQLIEVEVDAIQGTPQFIVIGLASKAVDEAKERITAALLNCGVRIKARRTVVNLAPADIQKSGSTLELAIAAGLLQLYGEIAPLPDTCLLIGELSLDGELKPVRGCLPLVLAAQQFGLTEVLLPTANLAEVGFLSSVTLRPLHNLRQLLATKGVITQIPVHKPEPLRITNTPQNENFAAIIGQTAAKRALEIAVAGNHNIHLVGPPGAGKSMLAQAAVSILPPLSTSEVIAVTMIHSVAGLTTQAGVVTTRPFRAPHHTTTAVGLTGGSAQLLPGEISLAHEGVLFLDEFPEFSRSSLEALRQPLESKVVTITRSTGTTQYPANCMLIAASNPCQCGYWGSDKPCRCTARERLRYHNKLSGPLLDRIDLHVRVGSVSHRQLTMSTQQHESSDTIRQRVIAARERQRARLSQTAAQTNGELDGTLTKKYCKLLPTAKEMLIAAGEKLGLSARTHFKVIKVAQTIADISSQPVITVEHITEALQYRPERAS
ncbi:MAG: YifB family Mg chelatase-like AAA ATPase [bacterium]|nr:YifB family Mg chelatase-like AAA ATPase [bacterium]